MPKYRIERVTFDHIPWVRLLYSRLVAEERASYPIIDEAELDQFVITLARMIPQPQFWCSVAVIGRKVVGFLAGELYERPVGRPHKVCNPYWLYVTPKHRHKGVTRQLIAAGVEWLTAQQVEAVELSEAWGRQQQWERRGFHPYLVRYTVSVPELRTLGAAHASAPVDPPDE